MIIGIGRASRTLQDTLSVPVDVHVLGETAYWDSDTLRARPVFPLQLAQLETIAVSEAKRLVFLEIPAVGGYLDEYWEIDMGNEVIMIKKPANPLADLREIVGSAPTGTINEEITGVRRAMMEAACREDGAH